MDVNPTNTVKVTTSVSHAVQTHVIQELTISEKYHKIRHACNLSDPQVHILSLLCWHGTFSVYLSTREQMGHSLRAGIALLLYLSSPTLPLASPSNYLLKCYQRNILNVSMSSVFSIVQCPTYCKYRVEDIFFIFQKFRQIFYEHLSLALMVLHSPIPPPTPTPTHRLRTRQCCSY